MIWIEEYQKYINIGIERFFRDRYKHDVSESDKVFQDSLIAIAQASHHTRIHPILSMVVYEEVLGLLAADSVVDILIGLEFIHIGITIHTGAFSLEETHHVENLLSKYGQSTVMLFGNTFFALGIECLARAGRVHVIQESIHAIGDFGVMRGYVRDILSNQDLITETDYIAIHDEEISQMIGAALVTGALVTGDMQQRFLDELKRFGTFLSRMYLVRQDIMKHETQQSSGDTTVYHKGVVDFLGYEKATLLRANIEFELVKMTNNFQSPKFKDLVEYFSKETL